MGNLHINNIKIVLKDVFKTKFYLIRHNVVEQKNKMICGL